MPTVVSGQVWERIWQAPLSPEEARYQLAKEERGIRWQRLEAIVVRELGGFGGLRAIEIGAGAGTNAALMAKRGATVTLLDLSTAALERARVFFAANRLAAELQQGDALALPPELGGGFDVAVSFGLAEHFRGEERLRITQAHFNLLRPGGLAFVSVPNAHNPPYRIYKLLAEALGVWKVGEEYPYTRGELGGICRQCGVSEFGFFGDNWLGSWGFLSPVRAARKVFGRAPDLSTGKLRKEGGTPLDAHLAYSLVLHAKK